MRLLTIVLALSLLGCATTGPTEHDQILGEQLVQGLGVLERELTSLEDVAPGAGELGSVLAADLLLSAETLQANVIGKPVYSVPLDPSVARRARDASNSIHVKNREANEGIEDALTWGLVKGLGGLGLGGFAAGLLVLVKSRRKWGKALVAALHALNTIKHGLERDKDVDVPAVLKRASVLYPGAGETIEGIYTAHVKEQGDIL